MSVYINKRLIIRNRNNNKEMRNKGNVYRYKRLWI